MAETAIVTIVRGRHQHLAEQCRSLDAFAPGVHHVVVAMGDPAVRALVEDPRRGREVLDLPVDGPLPLATARNVGAAHAIDRGAELLWLLDVDCTIGPDSLESYRRAARAAPDALLAGPVTYLPKGLAPPHTAADAGRLRDPHPARPAPPAGELQRDGDHDLLWSLNLAMLARTWSAVGGFCEEYVGYGAEDTDVGWTARERGVELVWVGGADAWHQWHPVSRPPVEHLEDIVANAAVAHRRWGRWPMQGWLRAFHEAGLVQWDLESLKVRNSDTFTTSTRLSPPVGGTVDE